VLNSGERHIGVDARDGLCGDDYLCPANIAHTVKHLPLEIGKRDDIIINHADSPYSGGGKILDRGTTNPACANQQDMRTKQPSLPCPANFLEDNMAGVAIKLVVAEGQSNIVKV
jgi:hypothetical protein